MENALSEGLGHILPSIVDNFEEVCKINNLHDRRCQKLFNQIENSPVGQRAIVGEVKQEIFVPVDGTGEDRLLVAK